MIIRDHDNFYRLIRQHDHGLLAGDIAAHWGGGSFTSPTRNHVLTASLHDLSWIETDAHLQWDDEASKPYDFITLPDRDKIAIYEKGLAETERLNPYSALLVSMHYCSFFKNDRQKTVDRFLQSEAQRQQRLKEVFFQKNPAFDLRLLQLWDNLSLYVCLNPAGVAKEDEHAWFKDGIGAPDRDGNTLTLQAHWLNERTITLDPFPFRQSFTTTLTYYKARKSLGPGDPDLDKAYHQEIRFVFRETL